MNSPRLFNLPDFPESNGTLIPVEVHQLLGWCAQRIFYVHAGPSSVRGGHAHHSCRQAIIALAGSLLINGVGPGGDFEFELNAPNMLLEIPPMCWATEKFRTEGIMLVLAQTPYDESEYIRDYKNYETLIRLTR